MVELFKVGDVADRWRVEKSWVYQQVARKQIPHRKIGKYLRFVPDELDAWFEKKRRGPKV